MGEFKKRINSLATWNDPELRSYASPPWVMKKRVFEIMEKAKKEFPDICAFQFHEGECEDCTKYYKWFEKWFGDD